jgi:ribose transport system ATP-binding protein
VSQDATTGSATKTRPFLEIRNIAKDFGPVRVLFGVDLALARGEVHALIGENGAGKSTLMKILAGYQRPSEGEIVLDGNPVRFANSAEAEAKGIVLIHQEFNLAEDLSVAANIFLGRELRRGPLLDRSAMHRRTREILSELETELEPRRSVRSLSVSQKQMVEIAKAVSRDARVLIMDEPTAVLTKSETEILFKLIRRLKASGVTIIYISHKLGEVEAISDRVTVLRDGNHVATRPTRELSQDEMASLMVGRDLSDMYPPKRPSAEGEVVLKVENLSVPGWVQGVSFELRRGEVLGLAGLVGAGRTELIEGLLGLRSRSSGRIFVRGREVRLKSVRDAIKHKLVYLTEDRKGKGLLVTMPLRPNLTLMSLERYTRFFIDHQAEVRGLERAAEAFDIRAPRLETRADTLSGGNQQKLVLAKIMETEPEIVILDEPTRGIDIGTKRQIYYFIDELVSQGKAVILISSEMQEIIGLSHRVVVMRSGAVSGTLEGSAISEDEIVRYAMGLKGAA